MRPRFFYSLFPTPYSLLPSGPNEDSKKMTELISLAVAERIATVTLGRPPVNAFNAEMFEAFHGILDGLAKRSDWSVCTSGARSRFSRVAPIWRRLPRGSRAPTRGRSGQGDAAVPGVVGAGLTNRR